MTLTFFPGLHQPSDAKHFQRACISIKRLIKRKKTILTEVIVDSGAFTELRDHGRYRSSVAEYARQLRRLVSVIPNIVAAVAQDYMCEPFILAKTGLTIADHQRLTIERYDDLCKEQLPFPIMPVLQGFDPEDYARHVEMYGPRLSPGMWVGVGSVCKRQGKPSAVAAVLEAILRVRPDLKLHGFGVKLTSLNNAVVRSLLSTADSMAWSYSARKQGRSANDWREARAFTDRLARIAA